MQLDEVVDRKGFNYGISKSSAWYGEMIKQRAVEDSLKESGSSDNKKVPVLSPEALREANQKWLRNDPNMSGKRKLMQLERHERLHWLYENGDLHKCLMSYFLLCVADDRMKLLSWMGSDMAKDSEKPSFDDLPPYHLLETVRRNYPMTFVLVVIYYNGICHVANYYHS